MAVKYCFLSRLSFKGREEELGGLALGGEM